ncbi:hypothetical protein BS78_07G001200 [Paspalum vaginatum]|nr:hypothetical protein BS78_07G001200 [Paspalum vaginatum]
MAFRWSVVRHPHPAPAPESRWLPHSPSRRNTPAPPTADLRPHHPRSSPPPTFTPTSPPPPLPPLERSRTPTLAPPCRRHRYIRSSCSIAGGRHGQDPASMAGTRPHGADPARGATGGGHGGTGEEEETREDAATMAGRRPERRRPRRGPAPSSPLCASLPRRASVPRRRPALPLPAPENKPAAEAPAPGADHPCHPSSPRCAWSQRHRRHCALELKPQGQSCF